MLQVLEKNIGPQGVTQDEKNSILRPTKVKFLNSVKRNPQKFMRDLAQQRLKTYQNPKSFRYHHYYAFSSDKNGYTTLTRRINLEVPPLPPLTPIVNLDGSPFLVDKAVYCTKRKRGESARRQLTTKPVQKRMTYDEQLLRSFELLEQIFYYLEQNVLIQKQGFGDLHGPLDWLHCRYVVYIVIVISVS